LTFTPEIYQGDFFQLWPERITAGTVDLILADPPYSLFTDEKKLRYNLPNESRIDLELLERIYDKILQPTGQVLIYANFDLMQRICYTFGRLLEFRFCHIIAKNHGMPSNKYNPITTHEFLLRFAKRGVKVSDLTFNPRESGKSGATFQKRNYNPDCSTRRIKKSPVNHSDPNGKRWITSVLQSESRCTLPKAERSLSSNPFQKSERLCRILIRVYSDPGSLIVDSFAGSGTTLAAAHLEGRRSIGFEIKEKYFLEARQRINTAVNQLPLLSSGLSEIPLFPEAIEREA